MSPDPVLVITCEHGGNRVPAAFRHLFAGAGVALKSHRGFDFGALEMAARLAEAFAAHLFAATTSRLVVDLNRSLSNPSLFSHFTRGLPPAEKDRLLAGFYHPWRNAVTQVIAGIRRSGRRVLHLSSHSFTPVFEGRRRRGDIGLLYDPSRSSERRLCLAWQKHLKRSLPGFVIRRNYPYRGGSDGFTRQLRREFGKGYLGIEVEVNQRFYLQSPAKWRQLLNRMPQSLEDCLKGVETAQIGRNDKDSFPWEKDGAAPES